MAAAAPASASCSVSGGERFAALAPADACARVETIVEEIVGAPLDGRVQIAITLGALIAKAEVIDRRSGKPRTLPTLYYNTIDRPMGVETIDALARAIGASLIGS